MQLGGNLAESGKIKFCIHINIYTQAHILYTLPEHQSNVWKTICIRRISDGSCDTIDWCNVITLKIEKLF